MKKNARRPPEEWPPAAQAAFLDFEATLSRLKDPSRYLRLLYRFFSHQQRQGLGFDEFPKALLDGYLATLTANARGRFRSSFSAWLRFLYERKEVSRPLHKELLPGNQVHPPRCRVSKLDIRPPEEWPPAAQELYCEFETRLSQRLQRPRTYLRLLYCFFSRQHQQGLSFREFPRAFLDAYLAPLKAQLRSEYVTALTACLLYTSDAADE